MIGLIQRVSEARVSIDGEVVAAIDSGMVVLVGMQPGDDQSKAQRLLTRLLGYRVFADAQGRMNRSLTDTQGGLLLVPNFTLAADTKKGARPGFSSALDPTLAAPLFDHLCHLASQTHPTVAYGAFGAHMQVSLTNDGPVTLSLTV